MNTATRDWLTVHEDRQRAYAADLAACGTPEANLMRVHAVSAVNALRALSLCECAATDESKFAARQAAKFTRRAEREDDTTVAAYSLLIASIFEDAVTRMGDIGEPLHTEEGEDEDEPLYVPSEVPARPEPVPA